MLPELPPPLEPPAVLRSRASSRRASEASEASEAEELGAATDSEETAEKGSTSNLPVIHAVGSVELGSTLGEPESRLKSAKRCAIMKAGTAAAAPEPIAPPPAPVPAAELAAELEAALAAELAAEAPTEEATDVTTELATVIAAAARAGAASGLFSMLPSNATGGLVKLR